MTRTSKRTEREDRLTFRRSVEGGLGATASAGIAVGIVAAVAGSVWASAILVASGMLGVVVGLLVNSEAAHD
jgi:hypothetical protein